MVSPKKNQKKVGRVEGFQDFHPLLDQQKEQSCPYEAKISIILLSFGQLDLLNISLKKIFEQSYENLEIILLDAGEYEKTLEELAFFKTDIIQHIAMSQSNKVELWNRGIKLAKGRYVCLLKEGEYLFFPQALQHLVCLIFDNQEPDLIYDIAWCDKSLEKGLEVIDYTSLIYSGGKINARSFLFKKEIFYELGFLTGSNPELSLFKLLSRALTHTSPHLDLIADGRLFSGYEPVHKNRKKIWKLSRLYWYRSLCKSFGLRGLLTYLKYQMTLKWQDFKKQSF